MKHDAKALGAAQRMRLGDVARIQPGYFCRGRVQPAADGAHYLLQARDVASGSRIHRESLVRFVPERNPELYLVSRGDVLLTAKGQRHRAYFVQEDLDGVLASSVFYILRPDQNVIRPGFLAWWLALPRTKAELKAKSRGTGIKYIDKTALGDLPVHVPPLNIQEQIEKVAELRRREASMRASIEAMKDQLIEAACLRALKEE